MLATIEPDIAQRRIYACAPPGFLEIAGQYLQALGVPSEHYHTESFTPPKLQRPAVNSDIKHQIRFNRSAIAIDVDGSTTLLEAARQAGLRVQAGCEQGLCKACVCAPNSQALRSTKKRLANALHALPCAIACHAQIWNTISE